MNTTGIFILFQIIFHDHDYGKCTGYKTEFYGIIIGIYTYTRFYFDTFCNIILINENKQT